MKIQHIYTLILCAVLSLCTVSCDENVNDWPVDPSYERPFRPTSFGRPRLWATSVELGYYGVVDASKYIFEFSEGDSLLFNNIVRTEEVLADTLTVYTDNIAPTKREYRTIFTDLKGTTRYSVRVKAINTSGQETGWIGQSFDTPAEQVMTRIISTPNSLTVYWDITRPIDVIRYGVYVAPPTPEEGAEPVEPTPVVYTDHVLTPEELAAGAATLTGLEMGTDYEIMAMLGDQVRGTSRVRTSGRTGSQMIVADPAATGSSIETLLKEQVAAGNKDVTLVFPVLPGGARYEIGQINVPDGIETLHFAGSSTTSVRPQLFLHAVRLSGLMNYLNFQNIAIDAANNSSAYFFNIDNVARAFKSVSFRGCTIQNIDRSLVRLNAALEVDDVVIDDCIIRKVSKSYGLYNNGNANSKVKLVSITNSTLMEIGDQVADVNGTHDMFIMSNVILSNYDVNLPKFFNWRKAPAMTEMMNNIFTGTQAGKVTESSAGATGKDVDFSSSYKTNEWASSARPLNNITEVAMSGEELFVDPRNGDFHIKEGVRFTGANVAGDPRWFVFE